MYRPVAPFLFENPLHNLIVIAVLGVILIIAHLHEKLIERERLIIMDNKALAKIIRQQLCRISDRKTGKEMDDIVFNIQLAVCEYKQNRRKAFWRNVWRAIKEANAKRQGPFF